MHATFAHPSQRVVTKRKLRRRLPRDVCSVHMDKLAATRVARCAIDEREQGRGEAVVVVHCILEEASTAPRNKGIKPGHALISASTGPGERREHHYWGGRADARHRE